MSENIKQYFDKGSFDCIKYDEKSIATQGIFKEKCEEMEFAIRILQNGRERDMALIKIEECYMWIGKAIRDGQILRNNEFKLQEGEL